MMGKMLYDPWGTEAGVGNLPGLGWLDMETTYLAEKQTHRCHAKMACTALGWYGITNQEIKGYEIHTGQVTLGPGIQPLLEITCRSGQPVSQPDGAAACQGRILGTHLHGLFDNPEFLLGWINFLRLGKGLPLLEPSQIPGINRELNYDRLAAVVRQHLDMAALGRIMGLEAKEG